MDSDHAHLRTRVLTLALVFSLVTLAVAGVSRGAMAEEDGFVPLFNGINLDGWEGAPGLWSVKDGVIEGSTEGVQLEHNSFLVTKKHYADFVLRVKVRLGNHNSGIQFRSEVQEDFAAAGYQADVAEETYFGMLYEENKRGFMPYWEKLSDADKSAIAAAVRKDAWNEYEITCRGDRITLVLNGYTTCDIVDAAGAKSGVIGLQLHAGPSMRVAFRDISIQVLEEETALLMPDVDLNRREKIGLRGDRFRRPDGFTVEEVASHELVGSVINMTFDHLGRPVVSAEGKGIRILLDEDGDGIFEGQQSFTEEIDTAMGMHFLGPGDLLVHSNGPEGPGLYRVRDTTGDGAGDTVTMIMKSNGGIGEHGPHTILTGPDGYHYILYGNHAHPRKASPPSSPLFGLREDYFLPRYVDPRGHANNIRAPGGTVHRVSPDLSEWSQLLGGFRNPFDMAMDESGEIMIFDSDMEWDYGLPWYRDIRVIHAVPGGDYGWRTGSSKMPYYYLDTLPGTDNLGRGSPVGVCFYYHNAYPEKFKGALFTGDWSRGRIRVIFPKKSGGTYSGKSVDFVVGEPLNVTDMDVGPDGFLYFTTGGRQTQGGVYRVTYKDGAAEPQVGDGIDAVLSQPMPRSAWARVAMAETKESMGEDWGRKLRAAAKDSRLADTKRLHAIEAMQTMGPQPDRSLLLELSTAKSSAIRAQGVFLLGTYGFAEVEEALTRALKDEDSFVVRRACEALVRSGLNEATRVAQGGPLLERLFTLLDDDDRFVRYAARHALTRTHRQLWVASVLDDDVTLRPRGAIEGLTALIHTQRGALDADRIFAKLEEYSREDMTTDIYLMYLRALQLAFIRDVVEEDDRQAFMHRVGSRLLNKFPSDDARLNRELQLALAYFETPGAIGKMLDYLTPDKSQEEQIHTVYALRTIEDGWKRNERDRLVEWFDTGREIAGAASMAGFINNLWDSTLEILPEKEREIAKERRADALRARREQALALVQDSDRGEIRDDLAQMSFKEMSEYLEYDPMAYKNPNLKRGEEVFRRAKCLDCHVFGSIGRGGGPDLSTVTSRFRRADILESIMFPSKVISDQYTGIVLELDDLSTVTGMVVGETDTSLTLITVLGERVDVDKSTIESRQVSETSTMPEGLLSTMSLGELVNLMQFLERGADL